MAISGNGEPEAGQEVNLSQEVPSPALHDEVFERVEIEAGAGDFTGRVSFWVRGHLLPSAELITLWIGTGVGAWITWAIFHAEGVDAWITLSASAAVATTVFVTGRAYLRRR